MPDPNSEHVIPDIRYRESRLDLSKTKTGFIDGFLGELFVAGFRPRQRDTFVSEKEPKTMFARARPTQGERSL